MSLFEFLWTVIERILVFAIGIVIGMCWYYLDTNRLKPKIKKLLSAFGVRKDKNKVVIE